MLASPRAKPLARERAQRSEPRERSEPAKRRARERVRGSGDEVPRITKAPARAARAAARNPGGGGGPRGPALSRDRSSYPRYVMRAKNVFALYGSLAYAV